MIKHLNAWILIKIAGGGGGSDGYCAVVDDFDATLQAQHEKSRRQRQNVRGSLQKIHQDTATSAQSVRLYLLFAQTWLAMSGKFMAIQAQHNCQWASE